MGGTATRPQMPTFRHTVGALKIRTINYCQAPNTGAQLVFADPAFAPVDLPGAWIAKHQPEPGGYYIVGDGGEELGRFVGRVEFEREYVASPSGSTGE